MTDTIDAKGTGDEEKTGEFDLPPFPKYHTPSLDNIIKYYGDLSDALMDRLGEEYTSGRITASHYSEIFMSTVNAALTTAMQFEFQDIGIKNSTNLAKAQWESAQQQILVEKAQIQDTIGGIKISGVLGKQRDVYQAQVAGFKQKSLQDAASSLINTWTIRATAGDAPIDTENRLCDKTIGEFVKALMLTTIPGINPDDVICPPPPDPNDKGGKG